MWNPKWIVSDPGSIKIIQSSSALKPERCFFLTGKVKLNGRNKSNFEKILVISILPRMYRRYLFASDRKSFMAYTKNINEQ